MTVSEVFELLYYAPICSNDPAILKYKYVNTNLLTQKH